MPGPVQDKASFQLHVIDKAISVDYTKDRLFYFLLKKGCFFMEKRSFLLRAVTKNDVAVFRALCLKEKIDSSKESLSLSDIAELRFSQEHGKMLRQIQKRNTILFDMLTQIEKKEYMVSAQPLDDMLEYCVMADLQRPVDESMSLILLNADKSFNCILSDKCKVTVTDSEGTEKIVSIGELDDELTRLFYSGFFIGETQYKPFIASASMSRVGQYFYVDSKIRGELIRQASLGLIDEKEEKLTMQSLPHGLKNTAKIVPNKIAAYMGLTLSDGQSVKEMQCRFAARFGEQKKPAVELDATNTICVADMDVNAGFADVLGPFCWEAEKIGTEAYSMAKLEVVKDFLAKLYDGCGFFSPELMDELEKLMLCKDELESGKRRYDSFVIRLPWMKGLSIRMDFLGFFRELLNEKVQKYVNAHQEKYNDLRSSDYYTEENGQMSLSDKGLCAIRIKDVYGINRPLWRMEDGKAVPAVRALFTQSMFKGFASFQQEVCSFKREDGTKDGWTEYWKRLGETGVTLLIATQNSKPGKYASVNYQLLATSGMSDENIKALLDGTVSLAKNLLTGNVKATADLTDGDTAAVEEEQPEDSGFDPQDVAPAADSEQNNDTANPEQDAKDDSSGDESLMIQGINLTKACKINPNVVNVPFIRSELTTLAKAQLINAAQGRLRVKGDYRFLVPDLIAMMTQIVNKQVYLPENGTKSSDGEPKLRESSIGGGDGTKFVSAINGSGVGYGCYYAPEIEEDEIVVFRNPHVCAGESVLLKKLPDNRRANYDKWCSKLSGLVLIPTAAAATLSGADHDGDRGLITYEPALLQSVEAVAGAEASLIKAAIKNREKLIALAEKQPLSETYRNNLKIFLEQLPEAKEGKRFSAGVIFDPVNTGDGKIELSNLALEEKLYDTWNITRKQRVGNMSLFALDISRHVYSYEALKEIQTVTKALENGESDKEETLLSLLERFLALWRCVDTSLNIANEIDSAKTGVAPKMSPLNLFAREKDENTESKVQERLFGKKVTEWCRFRHFRSKLKMERNEVSRFARDDKIRQQVKNASASCPQKTDGEFILSLNALPAIVNDEWKKLKEITPSTPVDNNLLDKDKINALPEGVSLEKEEVFEDVKEAITLRDTYREEAKHRSAARDRRDKLLKRFYHINRCLLRRYPLAKAQEYLGELMGDGSQQENALFKHLNKPNNETLSTMCNTLENQVNLVELLWAEQDGRIEKLNNLCGLDLVSSPPLSELFCADMDGIYLLKHVLHYLLEAGDMTQDAEKTPGVESIRTPKELRKRFEKIAGERLAKKIMDPDTLQQAKKQYALRLAVKALGAKRDEWLLFAILGADYIDYIKPEVAGQ